MSTIPTCLRPNRPNAFLQRLAVLLIIDEARRPRPRVSLPGQAPSAEIPPPVTSPVVRVQCEPHLNGTARIYRAGAEREDHRGPYSRDQLLCMDARFRARLERAIAAGTESRAAASASVIRRPPTP